ncbi:calcium-binding protein [Hellea balneolensis]|uniref:calcium-binding protein n=1 Tax=Hellea balneolensis TaxID=287478 RepID=UPI0004076B6B|nr:hypothetical protein [Hellea balneolensis]
MYKLRDNLDFFDALDLDVSGVAVPLRLEGIAENDFVFAPQSPTTPLEMTANAPVTPTLWQSVIPLPGPFEAPGNFGAQFDSVFLSNGNILMYREVVDPGQPTDLYGFIMNSFGNVVVADSLIQADIGRPVNVEITLNGGFVVVEPGTTPTLIFFDASGIQTSTLNLGTGPLASNGDVLLSRNDAGVLFITSRLEDPNVVDGDNSTYGWTVDASNVVTGPFVVADDGNVLGGANTENPFSYDIVDVNFGRFAVLVNERDSFGLALRETLHIEVINTNGTNHQSIELTAASDGAVGLAGASIAYVGGNTVAVTYRESSSQGGDGLWHIGFANVETGVLGSNSLLPVGSATSALSSVEITALEDTAGFPTGEYLLSFISNIGGNDQLHIQRYSAASTALGAEIILDTSNTDPDYRIEHIDVSRFAVIYDDFNGDNQYAIYSYASEGNIGDTGAYIGSAGDETLNNLNLSDEYYLGSGNDVVTESSNNVTIVDLGVGDDSFIAAAPSSNPGLIVEGGSGIDSFSFSTSFFTEQVIVDLATDGHLFFAINPSNFYVLSGIENIEGSDGDDDIRGDSSNNVFLGNSGDDLISGRGGNDSIVGGNGDDILFGGDGTDNIGGGNDDDIIIGGRGNDILAGGAGDDTFYQWNHEPGGFTDTIDGGADTDTLRMQVYDANGAQGISGTAYSYVLTGTSGVVTGGGETLNLNNIEIIYDGNGAADYSGSSGADTFFGLGGNDVIFGNGGDDYIDGGDGDDIISGGTGGGDTLIGGNGIDTADYTYTNGNLTVSLLQGTAFVTANGSGAETLTGIENLVLGNGDDIVEGDDSDNVLDGGNGDNMISGFDGNDTLIGGTGADTLLGGLGDDILSGNLGTDILNGGAGIDTGDFSYSTIDLTIDLENGTAYGTAFGPGGEQLISIENIVGGSGDDMIIGDSQTNNLDGGAGDDSFSYSDGDDHYNGGVGVDTLNLSSFDIQASNDSSGFRINTAIPEITARSSSSGFTINQTFSNIERFIGTDLADSFLSIVMSGFHFDGGGNGLLGDSLSLDSNAMGATVDVVNQLAFITSLGAGQGSVTFENIETFGTSLGDDILLADDGVIALDTAVFFSGGAGNDTLIGGSGDDILSASTGNDTIRGGLGADNITAGAGDDTIIYQNADEISTDEVIFGEEGTDRIVVELGDGEEIDFRDLSRLVSIEELQFESSDQNGETFVVFSADHFFADQFGGVGLANNLSVIGTSSKNAGANDFLSFIMDVETTLNLSSLTFIDWDGGNEISIRGDEDAEVIGGTSQDDVISSFGGNDFIEGFAGDDVLDGGDGSDNLDGGAGDDTLIGGTGDDFLLGNSGDDNYNGGDGVDTVLLNHSSENWSIDLAAGTASSANETETLISIESIIGSIGNDVILGDANDNTLDGNSGNDIITGGLGADLLNGDSGDDSFIYMSSAENAVGESIDGGTGLDRIIVELNNGSEIDFSYTVINLIEILEFAAVGQSGVENSVNIDASQIGGMAFSDSLQIIGSQTPAIAIDLFSIFMAGETLLDISSFTFSNWGGDSQELTIIGNGNDETIIGSGAADLINGNAGNDNLTGGAGDDVINGGSGTDMASFSGDWADYTITAIAGGFTISDNVGTDGTDTVLGFETFVFADQTLTEANLLTGGAGNTIINGTAGNDILLGTVDNDTINGLAGNDRLNGAEGDDILNGGEGADTLLGSAGADANNGGDGFDSVDYRAATSRVAFNVDTGGTVGDAAGDSFNGVERFYASDSNDTITGSDANEFFFGEGGNDTINAGGGIDRVYGGDGNDIQRGDAGNDQLYGSAGADQLNGGIGFDIANYTGAASAVIVNIATGGTGGDAAGDTYFGLEAIYGSDFNDSLTGNNSSNELRGFDGDDVLDGSGGGDRLFGGAGADTLIGGTGIDIAVYTDVDAGVTLDLATGGTGGEAAGDIFNGIEWVFGSDFDDDIIGDGGNNRLTGNDGNDTLNGAGGNDRLLGGDGDDTISGGDGVDTIFGQAGDDIMSGGAGNDFFFGDSGADSHDGGTGTDTVSYLASSSGVTVNIQTGGTGGDAAGDTYISIERIFGSGQADSLTGSDGNDTLIGNGGNDFLTGGLGNDSLNGGAGVDSFAYNTMQDDADVIQGFTTNEVIDILYTDPAFDSFAEIMAVATDAGANTLINFGSGNTLTIVGQNIADLSESNFTFTELVMAETLGDGEVFVGEALEPDVFTQDMAMVEMHALI